jgi:ERCC4-type nuclease
MATSVTLVVDDREKRGLEAAFVAANVAVEWRRLHDAADILICVGDAPLMAFERKGGADLTGSLKSEGGHLFKQRDQMLDFARRTGARVVLLVEDANQRGWTGVRDGLSNKFVEAVVASTTLLRGLYLARTRGPEDTVALVEYIRGKIQKEYDAAGGGDPTTFWARRAEGVDAFRPVVAKRGGHRANMSGKNAALAMLQQSPGMSLKRAEQVVAAFGSVAGLVTYYESHPDAGRGAKRATDEVADVKVGDRRLGEACSKQLRGLLFGESTEDEDEGDTTAPTKKHKTAE